METQIKGLAQILLIKKLDELRYTQFDTIKKGRELIEYLCQFSLSSADEARYNKKLEKLRAEQNRMELKYTSTWLEKNKKYNQVLADIRRVDNELNRNKFIIFCDPKYRQHLPEPDFFNKHYGLKIYFTNQYGYNRVLITPSRNIILAYEKIDLIDFDYTTKVHLDFLFLEDIKEILPVKLSDTIDEHNVVSEVKIDEHNVVSEVKIDEHNVASEVKIDEHNVASEIDGLIATYSDTYYEESKGTTLYVSDNVIEALMVSMFANASATPPVITYRGIPVKRFCDCGNMKKFVNKMMIINEKPQNRCLYVCENIK